MEHGTYSGYAYRRCRCVECRAAGSAYAKEYRLQLVERCKIENWDLNDPIHGTEMAYRTGKCRCYLCAGNHEYEKNRKKN